MTKKPIAWIHEEKHADVIHDEVKQLIPSLSIYSVPLYSEDLIEKLEAQRDHAYDCIQDLLDFVRMIAPEADAEEIDEAERVLGMLGNG